MTKRITYLISIITAIYMFIGLSCTQSSEDTNKTSKPPTPPTLSANSNGLIFSWFEENTPKVAMTIAEIPEDQKKEIRVQDPSIPPEKRDPNWIFIANLTKPKQDGTFPVKAVLRSDWEKKRHPEQVPTTTPETPNISTKNPVIMYATVHCPVCISARRWLVEQKIPFIEKNLDQDPAASKELAVKGQAQGVPVNGVPVFDINGHLLPGFDKPTIKQLLKAPPRSAVPPQPMPSQPQKGLPPGVQAAPGSPALPPNLNQLLPTAPMPPGTPDPQTTNPNSQHSNPGQKSKGEPMIPVPDPGLPANKKPPIPNTSTTQQHI